MLLIQFENPIVHEFYQNDKLEKTFRASTKFFIENPLKVHLSFVFSGLSKKKDEYKIYIHI